MANSPHVKRRGRGRPRGGSTDARERIVSAAVEEFAEKGYDGATIRAIAVRAGVDSSLVHHYFGSKSDLFSAVVDTPVRPDLAVKDLLEGPREDLGQRIVRYVLETWDRPEVQKRGVGVLRSAIGSRVTTPVLAGFLSRELLSRIARVLDAPDADLRATLAASQIAGLLAMRYILRVPAMAEAPREELVAWLGPTVQRYLTGQSVTPE